jgi:hypothetical protein
LERTPLKSLPRLPPYGIFTPLNEKPNYLGRSLFLWALPCLPNEILVAFISSGLNFSEKIGEVYPACPSCPVKREACLTGMESSYPIPPGPAPFNSLQKRSEADLTRVKLSLFLFNWGGFNRDQLNQPNQLNTLNKLFPQRITNI